MNVKDWGDGTMSIKLVKKHSLKKSVDAELRALKIDAGQSIVKSYEENKLVIFVKVPAWVDGESGEAEQLTNCYIDALKIAEENNCKSIAVPLELTENVFPKNKIYPIVVKAISGYLENSDLLVYLSISNTRSFKSGFSLKNKLREYISKVYVPEEKKVFISWRSESTKRFGVDFGSSYSGLGGTRVHKRACKPYAKRMATANGRKVLARRRAKGRILLSASLRTQLSDELSQNHSETFSQAVLRIITEKGWEDPDCYKAANMDRRHFSKIRCNPNYHPEKRTAVSLAIALELNLDDTNELLKKAGYALSKTDKRDVIVMFFIEHEIFDIFELDGVLLENGQELLTSYD